MVGKTRPYAQIIQLTMPMAQLPIPNFIFHMALALILVYLQLKVWGKMLDITSGSILLVWFL
jgi:hypothetical protein